MPSKKQLEKEAKRVASMRTLTERQKEITTLRTKLCMFGFPTDCEGMIEVEKAFTEYLERGETVNAKISFKEWDRIAEILLPIQRETECSILLRYVGKKPSNRGIETSLEVDAALVKRANELLDIATKK